MSKAVMISIQPKWCELIASGKKTIEVRKTAPKIDTPFKCYIYETKGKSADMLMRKDSSGKSVFTYNNGKGKIIGVFVCDRIEKIERDMNDWLPKEKYDLNDKQLAETCLTQKKLWEYGDGQLLYGWHISNLKIYDNPKELGEFIKGYSNETQLGWLTDYSQYPIRLTRPPQSWCYVEEI